MSLSVLQAANYILPLITVPYLVRVLGPEKFGLVAFAQAFAQYFVMFIDYGFNFSATREIALHRRDSHRLSEIFSSVIFAKLILAAAAVLIFVVIVSTFGKFRQDALLYAVAFSVIIGNLMFFQWFFQGMEKMKYITLLNITTKVVFVLLIFYFVKRESDYVLTALFYSLGFIFSGLISIYVVCRHFSVKLVIPSIKAIKREFINGYYIFITAIASSLYTTGNIFILGMLTNNIIVGYYSAGEKLVKAVQALFNPISQSIFPHISALAGSSKTAALSFVRKVVLFSGAFTFLISLLLLVFAPQIVQIVLGDKFAPTVVVIRILAFLPFVCSLGNIFGTQLMINLGLSKVFAWIISGAGIVNLILAIILIPLYRQNGMALAVITTETLITLSMFIVLEIRQLSPRNKWIVRG